MAKYRHFICYSRSLRNQSERKFGFLRPDWRDLNENLDFWGLIGSPNEFWKKFGRLVLSEPKRPIFKKFVRTYVTRFFFSTSGLPTYYRGSLKGIDMISAAIRIAIFGNVVIRYWTKDHTVFQNKTAVDIYYIKLLATDNINVWFHPVRFQVITCQCAHLQAWLWGCSRWAQDPRVVAKQLIPHS
jgi:hypothetical protein